MRKITLVLFALACYFFAQAQPAGALSETNLTKLKEYEDTLALCAFAVINDSLPENRFGTCKKLIKTLVQALKVENSFTYPFSQLKSVSIQYPPDSTFRIFTWQLYVDKDDYRYYGAIQMNTPQLQLFPLIDRSFEVEDVEREILSPDKWYGVVYYNLRQFDTPEGRKYLLFGFDGYSFFNKRKVAEVLSFQDGKAIFGAPVFVKVDSATGTKTVRNRLLHEYSAEASVKFNFDPVFDMILFDHLTATGGNYGQGLAMVPDGTQEGYKLEKGKWMWIEKVFNQTMDEAPRPEPVLDQRKESDVFGKPKKKGGKSN